jgi:hypothetical protein
MNSGCFKGSRFNEIREDLRLLRTLATIRSTDITLKMKRHSCAVPAAPLARPAKPNAAARRAITTKMIHHGNIGGLLERPNPGPLSEARYVVCRGRLPGGEKSDLETLAESFEGPGNPRCEAT